LQWQQLFGFRFWNSWLARYLCWHLGTITLWTWAVYIFGIDNKYLFVTFLGMTTSNRQKRGVLSRSPSEDDVVASGPFCRQRIVLTKEIRNLLSCSHVAYIKNVCANYVDTHIMPEFLLE
jgi:hypothetical protein